MLTSDSRKALSDSIVALRALLVGALKKHAQSRYQLALPMKKCTLTEPLRTMRARLEQWLDERERAGLAAEPKAKRDALRERALDWAVHEAAATLVNRLVVLRSMEGRGLARTRVLEKGWNSAGYREFREWAPALCKDESEGYATLLEMVFRELSVELPGLFGEVGLTGLFDVPVGALREAVTRLDAEVLREAWDDDTTPGWVYQYWNDPERERLDGKITDGGKIEAHEIASKTQMFTERYMVEWLLQNTLGLQWLALCQKKGWTADALSILPALAERRAAWRAQRARAEVAADALVPVAEGLEQRWCYWVEQPVPAAMVASAPDSVRDWRILDPACGSGHFLVIAFGLLFELHREEARHRGDDSLTDAQIAQRIVEDNLHGVDLDPRAVQLAAASLWLTMKARCPDARPARINLVATAFDLAKLPHDDEALAALKRGLELECGLDARSTDTLLARLKGLDAWGSLVRIHKELDEILAADAAGFVGDTQSQLSLGDVATASELARAKRWTERDRAARTRAEVEAQIEAFLSRHTSAADLGVRLDGAQLSAGVRFAKMMREGSFDVVVGNPPYHTTAKLAEGADIARQYPDAKTDLFAAFYVRGLELARPHGAVGFVTLSNWMFLGSFEPLRKHLLAQQPRLIADFGKAAFTSGGTLISTSATIIEKTPHDRDCVVIRPYAPSEVVRDDGQPYRTWAALLAQRERYEFDPNAFSVIEGEPFVYWWSKELLERYAKAPKLGEVAPVRLGVRTSDNTRFLRCPWELPRPCADRIQRQMKNVNSSRWVPYIKGAEGRSWIEPLNALVLWEDAAYEVGVTLDFAYGMSTQSPEFFFVPGIAFSMIGANFSARAHRFHSVIGDKGSSVFSDDTASVLLGMNSTIARTVLQSLNPTVSFQVGDVNRLPLFPVESADAIYARVDEAFTQHERAREASVEFVCPGRSAWEYAQAWAQEAVDRAAGEPLPPWRPEFVEATPWDHVSYAVGQALGRFATDDTGIVREAPIAALPAGILFVSDGDDSLDHRACAPLHAAWKAHGPSVGEGDDLRAWLRKSFFAGHLARYEKRPIYLPLSSARKSFVAWVSIHRWTKNTLTELLADHLEPARRALESELSALREAKATTTDKKSRAVTERKASEVSKRYDELREFVDRVRAVSEQGAGPVTDKSTPRERDHRFEMDLDDGVMVNSAALWPLLEPQWKDPRKWWDELSKADGRKDYDWSHMAKRYWPTRVRAKCESDPSLAVAHGCFWELHPEKAFQWEQRSKGELGEDWVIDEAGAAERRAAWVKANEDRAREIIEQERARRARKASKRDESDEDDGALLE
jgi:hypothetical protein